MNEHMYRYLTILIQLMIEDIHPSHTQRDFATFSIVFGGILSMLSTLVVFIRYLRNTELQKFEFFLIVTLCVGDFIQSSSITLPALYFWANDVASYENNMSYCITQGFFQEIGCLMQFIWTTIIAYSAYAGIQGETEEQRKRRKIMIYIVGFGIPIVFALIPLNNYVQNDPELSPSTCFIESQKIELLLLFGIPLIVCLILNFYLYSRILSQLKSISDYEVWDRQLLIYPLILIFCQGWFCFYFIVASFADVNWYNYQIWCYFTSNLTGFFDGFAYGLNLQAINDNSSALSAYTVLSMQKDQSSRLMKDVEM